MSAAMHLKILLPFQVMADVSGVSRIVAEGSAGSFGLLPQRLDCVTSLVPGILIYETEAEGEMFAAVDRGVLVKAGAEVMVSVRRAHAGSDLAALRAAVEREFLTLDEQEQSVRTALSKMESDLVQRMWRLQHD